MEQGIAENPAVLPSSTGNGSHPQWLSVSMAVEILGEEEGYAGSFSTATMLSMEEGTVRVEYCDFLVEDESAKLQETFTNDNIFRVRPAAPASTLISQFKHVKAGHTVDVLLDDCWWIGIVKEVLSTRIKVVLTERENEIVTIQDLGLIRLGYVWVPSDSPPRWYRRRVTQTVLKSIGITGHQASKVTFDLASMPCLLADGTEVEAALIDEPVAAPATRSSRRPNSAPRRPLVRERKRNWEGSSDEEDEEEEEEDYYSEHDDDDDDDDDEEGEGKDEEGGKKKRKKFRKLKKVSKSKESRRANAAAADEEEDAYEGLDGLAATRARREGKARIVYVDGHPVLKENMYDLDKGEPSVFEKELAAKKGRGDGTFLSIPGLSLAPPNGPSRPKTYGAPSVKGPDYLYHGARRAPGQPWSQVPEGKRPKAMDDESVGISVKRSAHNESVKKDRELSDVSRALFLKSHLEKLRPFITPQVAKMITDKAATAAAKACAVSTELTPPEPVSEQPRQITGTLREYQMVGLAWMVRCFDHGVNAILADEMGLGKTLQSISFLAYLKYNRGVDGPHLVVVPLSVLPNWMAEFRKWCPQLKVVRLHVNDEGERKRLRRDVLGNPSSFDVAVTTYDMVNSQHFGEAIRNSVVWRYVILDEGHKVKNEETLVSQSMRKISRQHVLMLTGTPVQNNLRELYALLNFMYPDVFTDGSLFDSAFNLVKNTVDDSRLSQAHYLLRPFMLRRVKDEVECKLPPRLETRIDCPLSEMQTFWYRRLLLKESFFLAELEGIKVGGGPGRRPGRRPKSAANLPSGPITFTKIEEGAPAEDGDEEGDEGDDDGGGADDGAGAVGAANAGDGGGNKSWQRAMNLLMQLRKCCNHPWMFPDSEPDYDGTTTGQDVIEGSGKMQILDRLLEKLKARGHRVVLFSQFNIMLDVIEDYLIYKGYKYRRLDGSTNRIQRMIDIEMFNKKDSDIFIYILCTRAGGLGVNLQTADTCVLYDSDWNPQWDLQAMARVHRIGQTKPVHVYRLCTEGTVEARIQRRAEQKLYLDQMVNRGSTAAAEEMEALDKKELMSMLKFGADRIFKNDRGRTISEEELDALLDRSQMMAEQALKEEKKEAAKAAAAAGESAPSVIITEEPAAAPAPAPASPAASPAPSKPSKQAKGSAAKDKEAPPPPAPPPNADAAGPSSNAAQGLQDAKHTVAGFNAEENPLSTFMLDGIDYKKMRELQTKGIRDIARDWAGAKRERKSRTTDMMVEGVGKVQVLNENNYTMQQGGISVAIAAPVKKRGKGRGQVAGRDYGHLDYCQQCWDGGELLCCDYCPASFHPPCIGMTMKEAAEVQKWACPHHTCSTCGRNTAAAGGLLFRCEACPRAFCEDCLPDKYEMVGECDHFKAMGQIHPKQACFILCSETCREQIRKMAPMLEKLMDEMHEKAIAKAALDKEREAEEAIKAQEQAKKDFETRAKAAALSAKETAAMAAMKSEGTGEEEGEEDDGRKKSGRARVASNKALAHLDEPLPASKRKPKKQHIKNTKGQSAAPTPAAPAASRKRPHSAAVTGLDVLAAAGIEFGTEQGGDKRLKTSAAQQVAAIPVVVPAAAQAHLLQQQMIIQHLLALQQMQALQGQAQALAQAAPPASAPGAEPSAEAPQE